MKKFLLGAICLAFIGCAPVAQVSLKGGVGDELRQKGDRYSAKIGVETKLDNGVKIGATYRHRITEFGPASIENGFFLSVAVPIWKKQK